MVYNLSKLNIWSDIKLSIISQLFFFCWSYTAALPSPVSIRSALPYFCVFLAMVPMLDMWCRSVWEWDESDEYPVTSGGAEWFSGGTQMDNRGRTAVTQSSHSAHIQLLQRLFLQSHN